jgi:Integrase core domain/Integrase zinc binding domain
VLAAAQATCEETKKLARDSSLRMETVEVAGARMLCDVSTGVLRPAVLVSQRRAVFEAMHGLAHPGTRASRRIITSRFVWHGCSTDVGEWCRECTGCAKGKVTVHCQSPVEMIPVPAKKFNHVHLDIVGPMPTAASGERYMLTMIDRTSCWPEVVPMSDITVEKCADSFVEGWISRFGVPDVVTTDRGPQFTSAMWACLASKLGFKHVLTSSYHPQSNGMVERLHRQIKDALRARACGNLWAEHLPWVMLGIRAAPKEDSGISSAMRVYGEALVLPGQPAWAGGRVENPQPPPDGSSQQQIPHPRLLVKMSYGYKSNKTISRPPQSRETIPLT